MAHVQLANLIAAPAKPANHADTSLPRKQSGQREEREAVEYAAEGSQPTTREAQNRDRSERAAASEHHAEQTSGRSRGRQDQTQSSADTNTAENAPKQPVDRPAGQNHPQGATEAVEIHPRANETFDQMIRRLLAERTGQEPPAGNNFGQTVRALAHEVKAGQPEAQNTDQNTLTADSTKQQTQGQAGIQTALLERADTSAKTNDPAWLLNQPMAETANRPSPQNGNADSTAGSSESAGTTSNRVFVPAAQPAVSEAEGQTLVTDATPRNGATAQAQPQQVKTAAGETVTPPGPTTPSRAEDASGVTRETETLRPANADFELSQPASTQASNEEAAPETQAVIRQEVKPTGSNIGRPTISQQTEVEGGQETTRPPATNDPTDSSKSSNGPVEPQSGDVEHQQAARRLGEAISRNGDPSGEREQAAGEAVARNKPETDRDGMPISRDRITDAAATETSTAQAVRRQDQAETSTASDSHARSAENLPRPAVAKTGNETSTSRPDFGAEMMQQVNQASASRNATQVQAPQAPQPAPTQVAEQITAQVRTMDNLVDREITVQMNPPELGRVHITFRSEGDALRGVVQVENSRLMGELKGEAPQLMAKLNEAGIQVKNLDFQMNDPNQGRDGGANSQAQQAYNAFSQSSGGQGRGGTGQPADGQNWNGDETTNPETYATYGDGQYVSESSVNVMI